MNDGVYGIGMMGLEGSGLSTVVGLIRQTVLKYGRGFKEDSLNVPGPNNRYLVLYHTAEREELDIIDRTMRGKRSFPPPKDMSNKVPLKFYLAFKERQEFLRRVLNLAKGRGLDEQYRRIYEEAKKYAQIDINDYKFTVFQVMDIAGEDIYDYQNAIEAGEYQIGSEAYGEIERILRVRVPIFLVDCNKLNDYENNYDNLLDYDQRVSHLINAFIEYRAEMNMNETYPVIIFTKCDALDESIKDKIGFRNVVDAINNGRLSEELAVNVASKVFTDYMPTTGETLRGGLTGWVSTTSTRFFFSWVETELGESGDKESLKLKVENKWNVYPEEEYLRLLDYIRQCTTQMDSESAFLEYVSEI